MAIYAYYLKTFPTINVSFSVPDKKDYIKSGFECVLSNGLTQKIALANANDVRFTSCQNKSNRNGYAKGMHDWFAN